MLIREATGPDIPSLIRGTLDLYQYGPWAEKARTSHAPTLAKLVMTRLQHDPDWALFIADDDPVVAGFIGVELVTHPLHPWFPFIREWVLWVHPHYRKQKVAWKLMERSKEWGRQVGARGLLYSKPLTSTRPKRGPVEQMIWIEL